MVRICAGFVVNLSQDTTILTTTDAALCFRDSLMFRGSSSRVITDPRQRLVGQNWLAFLSQSVVCFSQQFEGDTCHIKCQGLEIIKIHGLITLFHFVDLFKLSLSLSLNSV